MNVHDGKVTWRELLEKAILGDTTFDRLIVFIDEGEMDRFFDNGYGSIEGAPFTAWSQRWVYFPWTDGEGREKVGRAPRNPEAIALHHIGENY